MQPFQRGDGSGNGFTDAPGRRHSGDVVLTLEGEAVDLPAVEDYSDRALFPVFRAVASLLCRPMFARIAGGPGYVRSLRINVHMDSYRLTEPSSVSTSQESSSRA